MFMITQKLLILSDTHGYIDDKILEYAQRADLVIHGGDVGNTAVIEVLQKCSETKGVYGNIDGTEVRKIWPEHEFIHWGVHRILVIHIAGALGRYNKNTAGLIRKYEPSILICGHSHILKVQKDQRFNLLYINPGAIGKHGFHKHRTMIELEINSVRISDMKVIQFERGQKISQTT